MRNRGVNRTQVGTVRGRSGDTRQGVEHLKENKKKKKQTEKKLDVRVEKDFTLGPDRAEMSSNM